MPKAAFYARWGLAILSLIFIGVSLASTRMIKYKSFGQTFGIYSTEFDGDISRKHCDLTCHDPCVAIKVLATVSAALFVIILFGDIAYYFGATKYLKIRTGLMALSIIGALSVMVIFSLQVTHPETCPEQVDNLKVDMGFWLYVTSIIFLITFLVISVIYPPGLE